ncbi:hypothetical protein QBE52_09585 [Clostridiaceae bacterium 35-E11]
MYPRLKLFFKILLILMIFVILLPQVFDHIIKILILEEQENHPRGNSKFVMNLNNIQNEKHFIGNLFQIIKCFMKYIKD